MNLYVKKLISYLTLEVRNNYINTVIGYLNSLSDQEGDWNFVVNRVLTSLDLVLLKLLENDLDNNKENIKGYSIVFNNLYLFINEEFEISFINEAPFNNNRVNSIKDFKNYIIARRLCLNNVSNR